MDRETESQTDWTLMENFKKIKIKIKGTEFWKYGSLPLWQGRQRGFCGCGFVCLPRNEESQKVPTGWLVVTI